eukprot:1969738-Amphidinium_carterae.1
MSASRVKADPLSGMVEDGPLYSINHDMLVRACARNSALREAVRVKVCLMRSVHIIGGTTRLKPKLTSLVAGGQGQDPIEQSIKLIAVRAKMLTLLKPRQHDCAIRMFMSSMGSALR